jgi:hypothetical protein
VRARRIKGLEANKRKQERKLFGVKLLCYCRHVGEPATGRGSGASTVASSRLSSLRTRDRVRVERFVVFPCLSSTRYR